MLNGFVNLKGYLSRKCRNHRLDYVGLTPMVAERISMKLCQWFPLMDPAGTKPDEIVDSIVPTRIRKSMGRLTCLEEPAWD
jgi:hypothetical protein